MSQRRAGFAALVVALGLGAPALARAEEPAQQVKPTSRIRFGLDALAILPITDYWQDHGGPGVGLIARLDIPLDPAWAFTIRPGIIYNREIDACPLEVPMSRELLLQAGLRVASSQGVFAVALTGINQWKVWADFGDGTGPGTKEVRIPQYLGAGWSGRYLEAGVGVFSPNFFLNKDWEEGRQFGALAYLGFTFSG